MFVSLAYLWILSFSLILILMHTSPHVSGDAFTSSAFLKHMLESEVSMKNTLQTYLRAEERRLEDLKRQLDGLTESSLDIGIDNPIDAFHFLQKWYELSRKATDDVNHQAMELELSNHRLNLPSLSDHMGALKALVRLHKVYHLSTEQLASGQIHGHVGQPLTNQELLELSRLARSQGNLLLGAECLEIIHNRNHTDISEIIVATELAEIFFSLKDYENAINTIKEQYQKHPNDIPLQVSYNKYVKHNSTRYTEAKLSGNEPSPPLPVDYSMGNDPHWLSKYEALCRGEKLYREPAILNSLVCRYRKTTVPYALIKEEILNWDPKISMMYDVIGEGNIQYLKEAAIPELTRAKVGDPQGDMNSDNRISEVAWVWDLEVQAKRLTDDVKLLTGLETEYREQRSNSEPFQVVNYGMGGQYEPHVDYYESQELLNKLPPFIFGTGDRIVTFMYYLNQPIEGGWTVFPEINVAIPATKGAAAFWYNMNKAGVYDPRTRHAGCPVLLGEKWVANKWIRDLGQTFRRPCGKTPHDLDE